MLHSLVSKARSRIVRGIRVPLQHIMKAVAKIRGNEPNPLLFFRPFSFFKFDFLTPYESDYRSTGRDLRNARLAGYLQDEELGPWTLDAQTINFIESNIQSRNPASILELGSGVSTLSLAAFMSELGRSGHAIVSLEQDRSFSEETARRLESHGLARLVRLIHAPLVEERLQDGRRIARYDFDLESVHDLMPFDLVLIDGPAGGAGIRAGTLPSILPFLSEGSVVLLDDGLRPAELGIASYWARIPGVKCRGVRLIGKGVLEFVITRSNAENSVTAQS